MSNNRVSGGSSGSGCGCIFWIVIIVVVVALCFRLFGAVSGLW
jgi:hypothetical protein